MNLLPKPEGTKKNVAVPDQERCEARVDVSHGFSHRCDRKGELCKVSRELTHGFARLCKTHQASFTRSGFSIEPITPIERGARSAVGL